MSLLRGTVLLVSSLWLYFGGLAQSEAGAPADSLTVHQAFVQAAYRAHFAPHAAKFAVASAELKSAIERMCRDSSSGAVQSARNAWIDATLTWEAAGAILVGPLLERHTAANIDFWPTRPNMIEGALRKPPPDIAGLRRTGVAARGLPALEWLLWSPKDVPRAVTGREACEYTQLLAADITQEAQTLEAKFVALGATPPTPEDATKRLGEMINQTTGAVEVLRRKRLLNPVTIGNPKAFARSLSEQSQRAWLAQWDSINEFLMSGEGSIHALLIESGLESSAAHLNEAALQSSEAIRKAALADPASIRRAAEALMKLRRVLESDVAVPLAIPISFSDFDGD